MSASRRLGLSLAMCVAIAALGFAAAEWWWRKPAPELPDTARRVNPRPDRIEELEAMIEAQRAALRTAREQRGAATAELERLTDELSLIRERIDGLRERVQRADRSSE